MTKQVFLALWVAALIGSTQPALAATGPTLVPFMDSAYTVAEPSVLKPISLMAEDSSSEIVLVEGCSSCAQAIGACDSCGPCGSPPKPFKLFGDTLGCTSLVAGGWIQQGITHNGSNPANGMNGALYTNHRDDYMLNQAWLYLMRPIDTAGCRWDVGGRIDLVYGTDWPYAASEGLENKVNSADTRNGFILPQAYVEIGGYDWSIKIGRYATMWGHEVIPAPANFFYSHSLSMSGVGNPLLVTGIQADRKLSENLTLVGGVNRGWLSWEDINDSWDLLGGVKWTSCDKRTTLSFMSQTGPWDVAGDNNMFAYALVGRHQLSDRLSYAFQHNLGYADDHAPGGDDAEWYSLAQYLTYTINPCWSAGARFEVLRDDDGARVLSFGQGDGFAGEFSNLTLGLNWRPHTNVVFRPEVRWDWYDGIGRPFIDATESNQTTVAGDLVITF